MIMVIGGWGAVGASLVARLRALGALVRAVVRNRGRVPPNADPSVQLRVADLRAAEPIVPLLDVAEGAAEPEQARTVQALLGRSPRSLERLVQDHGEVFG